MECFGAFYRVGFFIVLLFTDVTFRTAISEREEATHEM